MNRTTADIVQALSSYFFSRQDVAFAFLFGSLSKGSERNDSDIDIGVYFFPQDAVWEMEDPVFYPEEDQIWADIDKLTGRETDLLVLNRSPARIVHTVLREGILLDVKSSSLFMTILLQAGHLAEEYLDFTHSYMAIKRRSASLTPLDKERLIRMQDFLETELTDLDQFIGLTYEEYAKNSALRRNVERWIENIVNVSIDIAKILIASEKQPIPQTYRETVTRLKTLPEFPADVVDALSTNIRLKNILAHEYLDIRFRYIALFIQSAEQTYKKFLEAVQKCVVSQ